MIANLSFASDGDARPQFSWLNQNGDSGRDTGCSLSYERHTRSKQILEQNGLVDGLHG
jgi:hypothetical protein